jgi:hypothetical protein
MDVEPELEPELQHWYNDEHIPELMQIPGFLRARRFSAVWEGTPRHLAVFDLESPDVLKSREYLELPVTPLRQRLRPHFKNLNRRLYSEIFTFEPK